MKTGSGDGLGEIYNDQGEIILHATEKILVTEPRFVPDLKTTWSFFGGDPVVDASPGRAVLTNERLVWIMELEDTMSTLGGSDQSMVQNPGMQMGGMKSSFGGGGAEREYFEILIKEILACEMKDQSMSSGEHVNVYILSKGEQFHLKMVLPHESELLKRFKKKTVENSGELVKNIKEYFENTNWIYTEEELAMMGDMSSVPSPPEATPADETPTWGGEPAPEQPLPEPASAEEDHKSRRRRVVKGPPQKPRSPQEKLKLIEERYQKGMISAELYENLKREYSTQLTQSGIDQLTGPEGPPPAAPPAAQPAPPPEPAPQFEPQPFQQPAHKPQPAFGQPAGTPPPQPAPAPAPAPAPEPAPQQTQADIDSKLKMLDERYKKGQISGELYQSLRTEYLNKRATAPPGPAPEPTPAPAPAPAPAPEPAPEVAMPEPTPAPAPAPAPEPEPATNVVDVDSLLKDRGIEPEPAAEPLPELAPIEEQQKEGGPEPKKKAKVLDDLFSPIE